MMQDNDTTINIERERGGGEERGEETDANDDDDATIKN